MESVKVKKKMMRAVPLSPLKEGKRSSSNSSHVSLVGVKIWRKKKKDRQDWLGQNEKPMRHKKAQQEMKHAGGWG